MELWDDGDDPLVTAVFELPGMRPEDVSVDVVDGRLIVSGERRPHSLSNAQTHDEHDEDEAPDGSKSTAGLSQRRILQVCELKYGFFRRVVAVPTGCTVSFVVVSFPCPCRLADRSTSLDSGPGCVFRERYAHRVMASYPDSWGTL